MEKQLEDIKNHESKMMQKIFEFTADIAEIKASQRNLEALSQERQLVFTQSLGNLEKKLLEAIDNRSGNFEARFIDLNKMVRQHDDILDRVVRIQEKQEIQLTSIQQSLSNLQNIQNVIAKQEAKIEALEKNARTDSEIKKEKIKGWASIIGTTVAGILSVIGIILAALLK